MFGISQTTVFQGEEVTAPVPDGATAELHSGDAEDSSVVRQLNPENGQVTVQTDDLNGDYVLQVNAKPPKITNLKSLSRPSTHPSRTTP